MARGGPLKRRRMRQGPSDKQAAKIASRIPVRDAYLAAHRYCEPLLAQFGYQVVSLSHSLSSS